MYGLERERLYRVDEVASRLNLSTSFVYRAMNEGGLSFIRTGERKGIRLEGGDVIDWLRSRERKDNRPLVDGSKVEDARLEWGFSQREAAVAAGIAPSTLTRIEAAQGPIRVNDDTAERLRRLYQVDLRPDEVLTNGEEAEKSDD